MKCAKEYFTFGMTWRCPRKKDHDGPCYGSVTVYGQHGKAKLRVENIDKEELNAEPARDSGGKES